MSVHKLGVKTRQAGGGGTVHKLSVEDCLEGFKNAETVPDGTLVPLSELTPNDFEDGLTIAAVSRCIDNPEIITRTITKEDIVFPSNDDPAVSISLDSLTVRYNLASTTDSPDVIRAIKPD